MYGNNAPPSKARKGKDSVPAGPSSKGTMGSGGGKLGHKGTMGHGERAGGAKGVMGRD